MKSKKTPPMQVRLDTEAAGRIIGICETTGLSATHVASELITVASNAIADGRALPHLSAWLKRNQEGWASAQAAESAAADARKRLRAARKI